MSRHSALGRPQIIKTVYARPLSSEECVVNGRGAARNFRDSLSRRDLCLWLPALLPFVSKRTIRDPALPARAYPFRELPVHRQGGNAFRPVLSGTTHTGFPIELHETTLAPGSRPHPPHHHVHEEIFLIRDGEVAVTIEGKTTRLGPGSVAYVASNVEHGIRNEGNADARYFVLALGTERG